MTTGASLKPDSASNVPVTRAGRGIFRRTEKTAAASVEETTAPMMSRRRGDHHAHRDPDQRQRGGGRQGRLDLLPLRAQTTFGQDHDEGRVSDDLGQFGVVEVDVADSVLAHEDADGQVHEQAWEPAARGDPDRCDGDEQDERADEQELVEVVDSQRPFPSLVHALHARVNALVQIRHGVEPTPHQVLRYLT
jgi:hypothetical protein